MTIRKFKMKRILRIPLTLTFLLALSSGLAPAPAWANPSDANTLAEHSIPRFFEVDRFLYRGGQPSLEDLLYLQKSGIRTVINMIADPISAITDEGEQVERLGMKYLSFPIHEFKGPSEETLQAIYAEMRRPSNQPVFIHCKKGKDRTGMMVGLYRVHEHGWAPEVAYAEMQEFGFNPLLFGLTWNFWKHVGRSKLPNAEE